MNGDKQIYNTNSYFAAINKGILVAVIISLIVGLGIGFFVGQRNLSGPVGNVPGVLHNGKTDVVGGVVKNLASNSFELDGGWTVHMSADTVVQFISGAKARMSDIKNGALVSVSLKNVQAPGDVSASNVKLIAITTPPGNVSGGANVPPPPGTPPH
jgi:hypothetical protein